MQPDFQTNRDFDPAILPDVEVAQLSAALGNEAVGKPPDDLWAQFLQSVGGYGNWRTNGSIQTALHQKITHFSPAHRNRPEHTEVVLYSLSRGYSLNKAAIAWEKPYAGKVPTGTQDISWLRGLQWRLVMSYNAFELVCVALMQPRQSLTPEIIKDFVQKCGLEGYATPIASPNPRAGIQQWFAHAPTDIQGHALLNFLGLRAGDRKAFQAWVLPKQGTENSINDWERAILLAKALRNMSAHGSLSATKIRDLGLKQAFETLPQNLCTVIDAAIGKLI